MPLSVPACLMGSTSTLAYTDKLLKKLRKLTFCLWRRNDVGGKIKQLVFIEEADLLFYARVE